LDQASRETKQLSYVGWLCFKLTLPTMLNPVGPFPTAATTTIAYRQLFRIPPTRYFFTVYRNFYIAFSNN